MMSNLLPRGPRLPNGSRISGEGPPHLLESTRREFVALVRWVVCQTPTISLSPSTT